MRFSRALSLGAPREWESLLIGMLVSCACFGAFCFRRRISSSDSSCSSGRKNCFPSSATSVDCISICVGVVRISSRIVRSISSLRVT